MPTAAEITQLQQTLAQLSTALAAVPNFGPNVLTSATIAPERLALADKAAEVAAAAPTVMRRSYDAARLPSWPPTASAPPCAPPWPRPTKSWPTPSTYSARIYFSTSATSTKTWKKTRAKP